MVTSRNFNGFARTLYIFSVWSKQTFWCINVCALLCRNTFRFSILPTAWKKYKNSSVLSRLIWSFVSGFFIIIGARLAGGRTSGHFLSSMIFGGVVMLSLIITGKIFYKSEANDV